MTVRYLVGDTRIETARIETGSVSLVATSPPFIALRSYLPDNHPMKHAEIGTEPDPTTFLDTLLHLTTEWGRVLAPWGSIAIELGDTFAGGGGGWAGVDDAKAPNRQSYANTVPNPSGGEWPRAKSLALIPQGYAMSLAYGRNILTGEPSPAGSWLVRNVVVWHRPNPPVGALGDKFRPSTSYIVVATRSPKRWFDLAEVRTSHKVNPATMGGNGYGYRNPQEKGCGTVSMPGNPDGAPPLDTWFDGHDTWTVTTQPSQLAHYAMWPPKLAERLVLSMCPSEVCATCNQPRRRVQLSERTFRDVTSSSGRSSAAQQGGPFGSHYNVKRQTIGWSDCGHDNYRPGVVLDPFAGTGTTLAVADCHERDAIGIDIDERNPLMFPARLAEVKRTLFNTIAPIPGQLDIFTTTETNESQPNV